MKRIINFIIVTCLLATGACNKFLDEKPTSFITPGSPLSSSKVARAFADACYQYTQGFLTGQPSSYGGNTWVLMEFMTGKASSDLGQTNYNLYQKLIYDYTSFYFDTWWQQMYLGIGACNTAIQEIPKIKAAGLSDDQKAGMLAEAHTMRALYYFYLVRMYGAVPKITQVATDPNTLKLPRTAAKAIYDSIIIPDLLLAEQTDLGWGFSDGHVTNGVVESILADVYLTYAGAAINGGSQYYAESAKRSLNVLQKGPYTLFTNYTDMINPSNKNKGEFIFQVQFSATANVSNPLTSLTIHNYSKISKYSDEYGSVYPDSAFLTSYPAGDKRAAERQFFYSSYPSIDPKNGIVSFGRPYIYKWFDSTAVRSTAKSDLNYSLYRLADVKLMYAEASNRAEGAPNATAIQNVNDIRQRAGLTPISTMSQTDFEHEVWLERNLELCFENKMWFDMIRTRKVYTDGVNGKWVDLVGFTNAYGGTYAEKNLLFPVPKQEIDVNPNLLPNNTGF